MSRHLIYQTDTGRVTTDYRAPAGQPLPPPPEGCAIIEVLSELPVVRYFVRVDGPEPIIGIRDGRPSAEHAWDRVAEEWVVDLDAARAAAWARVKAARDEAEAAGVEYDGVLYDSNAVSQQRIIGACVQASVDPTATWEWTAADNTGVTLTAADMIGLATAVATHVAACHAQGRVLRAQIDAAATLAELEAVKW